jgi:hypothetical protein
MLPNRHNLAKPDTSQIAETTAISTICELITGDQISLGVFGERAAQCLDALALDPGHRNTAVGQPVRDGKPAHAGGLHDGEDGAVRPEVSVRPRHEGIKRPWVMTETARPAKRPAVIVDLCDMIATDGEVDADSSFGHREDPCW